MGYYIFVWYLDFNIRNSIQWLNTIHKHAPILPRDFFFEKFFQETYDAQVEREIERV